MQSALWKVITAAGIIGIGTLVVLEVQQRLPPMQPGAAPGVTADVGPHGSGNEHTHADHAAETPFFEAATDDHDASHIAPDAAAAPGTPGVAKSASSNVAKGTSGPKSPAPASVRSAQVYTNLPKKADSAAAASSPEPQEKIDTTVHRDALAESLDPFSVSEPTGDDAARVDSAGSNDNTTATHNTSDAAAVNAPTDAGKGSQATSDGVKVASFQQPESFNGGSPFEEETSKKPGRSDDAAQFPALQTPPGVTDDNPFGEPFVPDTAPAEESGTPGGTTVPRDGSGDSLLPPTDKNDGGPFFPEDKPAETPQPAEELPEISLPTFPADDRSDNDSGNDRAGSNPAGNDSGSSQPSDSDRKRGSSIMFFGNDSQKNSSSGSDRSESERKQPFENEGAGRENGGVNRGPAPVFENDLDGNLPDKNLPGRNIPGGNAPRDLPEFHAPSDDRRLPPLDRRDPREIPRSGRDGGSAPASPADRESPRDIDSQEPFTSDPVTTDPARPGSDRLNDRPRNDRPDPVNPRIPAGRIPVDPEDARRGRDRIDGGRDSREPGDSEAREKLPRDDMFEPDVILPPAGSDGSPDRNSPREGSENTAETVPTTEVMRPHLTLRKDAPQTATVGVPLEYRIQVSNDGKHAAYDVVVEDEIPKAADLGSQTPQAEYDRANQKMFWKFDSLNPGEIKEIFVTVTPRGEGTLGGVATVRFKAQVKATTMVTAPKLSLKMEGPDEARSGDELNYSFVVRNDGTGTASDVILRTTLPAQLKHGEGDDLEYEIDTLVPNEEREIVLTLVANKPGEEKFQAEVMSSAESVVQRELPIKVIGAQLKLERLGPERRYVGRPAEFQNIVTNETHFEATDIIIRESVPDGMKFVSAKSGGEYDARKRIITWEIPRIEAEKQVLLDVELIPETAGDQETVVEVLEQKGFRSNVVKIVAVEDLHNISAETSRLDGAVQIGEKFKFSITIENRGTALASGVQLVVKVPPEIKILEGGTKEENIVARRTSKNEVLYNPVESIKPGEKKVFHLVLQGQEEITNGLVEGRVSYSGMKNPLIVSETVTIFSDSP